MIPIEDFRLFEAKIEGSQEKGEAEVKAIPASLADMYKASSIFPYFIMKDLKLSTYSCEN